MKLESLTEEKFKDNVLKKEQLFKLNGGGTKTRGGSNLLHNSGGKTYLVDYSYDVSGRNVAGGLTFHGYTNWRVQAQVESIQEEANYFTDDSITRALPFNP